MTATKPVSVLINAPVDAVFAFINDFENHRRIYPSVAEHIEIEMLPSGGHHCTQVSVFPSGTKVRGTSRCLAFEPPRLMSHRGTWDIGGEAIQTLEFVETGKGTRLTMTVDVIEPSPVVGRRHHHRAWLRHVRREFKRAQGREERTPGRRTSMVQNPESARSEGFEPPTF